MQQSFHIEGEADMDNDGSLAHKEMLQIPELDCKSADFLPPG